MRHRHAQFKAFVVTLLLTCSSLLIMIARIDSLKAAMPLIIFYIVLLINTYFSIRCFASITPPRLMAQHGIDAMLILLYVALAWNIDNPARFVFVALLLFIVAAMKYTLLLGISDRLALLRRKIFIDTLGILTCALGLGAILAGFTTSAVWIFAAVFVIANVYVFFISPLYTLDNI